MLRARRGVYRCRKDCSSSPFRMPSIQPQQSTTSMASAAVIEGRPELFLWILIQSSSSRSWFLDSHASKAAGEAKLRTFSLLTVTILEVVLSEAAEIADLEQARGPM